MRTHTYTQQINRETSWLLMKQTVDADITEAQVAPHLFPFLLFLSFHRLPHLIPPLPVQIHNVLHTSHLLYIDEYISS